MLKSDIKDEFYLVKNNVDTSIFIKQFKYYGLNILQTYNID